MPTRLESVVIDAADPAALARFWADALGWRLTAEEPDEAVVEAPDAHPWAQGGPPPLVLVAVADAKAGKNRVHLDLVSTSADRQRATVRRLRELGAAPVDIGQGAASAWVVLADPEGNELCVLEPRPEHGAAPDVAAVVMDCRDPAGLAPFWQAATGWPLVEASAELVAFAPSSTPGTRLELLATPEPKVVKNRLHVDLAPAADDDLDAEVARLEHAGARRIDIGQGEAPWVVLADPEGNELCVLTPR